MDAAVAQAKYQTILDSENGPPPLPVDEESPPAETGLKEAEAAPAEPDSASE